MEAMLTAGSTSRSSSTTRISRKEYELGKDENIRFAERFGIPFIDADYDRDNWFARAKGMENEAERGIQCTMSSPTSSA